MRADGNALGNVRIVLVAPSHPGNIGAVARAMRTMGLSELWLVRPARFPSAEATERAAGAFDILDRAKVVAELADALAPCRWSVATTARVRRLEWTRYDPAQAAREIVRRAGDGPVAVVFGRESAGLANDEIDRCRAVLRIPTDPCFRSLNIGSAVQIVAYEIARAAHAEGEGAAEALAPSASPAGPPGAEPVTGAELEGLFAHLEQALVDIGYFDPVKPRLLMRRLRRLFVRSDLDRAELNILRGILTAAQRAAGGRRTTGTGDRIPPP